MAVMESLRTIILASNEELSLREVLFECSYHILQIQQQLK